MACENDTVKIIKLLVYELRHLPTEAPEGTVDALLIILSITVALLIVLPLLVWVIVSILPSIISQLFLTWYISSIVWLWCWKNAE